MTDLAEPVPADDDAMPRRSGVVLHLTSLPGPHGLGDLGADAHRFIDWLAAAGQRLWQVLPVNPVGPGNSPYQCPSAFAGSDLMVSLQPLVDAGWLDAAALEVPEPWPTRRADYDRVIPWRRALLRQAAAGFFARARASELSAFEAWRSGQDGWLPEWALYAAIKDEHGGAPWWDWPAALARRDADALSAARQRLAEARLAHEFVQWCFDAQMAALRSHARSRGVQLMGDLPIFVAHDSAEVWARPDLYFMDEAHQLTVVAGVPPDGFGPDGQRWGNPLYRWERMAEDGYAWWVARVQRALEHADLLRIDHFRGFAGCWEVPASCPTAREGRWAPGPGKPLFAAILAAWRAAGHTGRLPIVAEDLGTITPDVIELRDTFGLPGMRIVQEAFGGDSDHPFLPHHHTPNSLAYTSTHDSDTAVGWWAGASADTRAYAAAYLRCDGNDVHWALIHAANLSVARLALFPLQDALGLGREHRMNLPGSLGGSNWAWRFEWDDLPATLAPRLARLAALSGRAALPLPAEPSPR